MTRRILQVALIFLVAGASRAAQAQQASTEAAKLQALDEQERVAVLKGDRAALARLWADSFTVNAPNNRINVGRDAVLTVIANGGMHYSVFERKVETVRVYGDIGIVMGSESFVQASSQASSPAATPRRFTNVWHRENGTWRLIARHANNLAP